MNPFERRPWILRQADRLLDPVFRRFPPLATDAVRRRAERQTGLVDWGDDDGFDERMERCLGAVRDEPGFTPVGQLSAAIYFHLHAANRLRMIDLVKRHPEVAEVPIERPVFVVGWYRTGTTYLHNLLAAAPGNRAPTAWELMSPVPGEGDPARDARRRRLRSRLVFSLAKPLFPEIAVAHAVDLDGPEECFFLLENDFVSSTLYNTMGCFDYAFDLLERDLSRPYAFARLQLQALAWQRPTRRWVLKSPIHLWHLDALMAAFPDARIVFTGRCIGEALTSNCSLSAMTTAMFSSRFDPIALGSFWEDYYRRGTARALDARRRIPDDQQLDLSLERLAADPVAAVRGIYDHFGMDFTEAEPAIEAKLREIAAQPKVGKHEYDPAMFGLDLNRLRDEFPRGILRPEEEG